MTREWSPNHDHVLGKRCSETLYNFKASNSEIESMRFETVAAGRICLICQWTRYNLQEMNRTVVTRAAVCDHNLRDIVLPSSDLGLKSQKKLEKCN
jgi:hypothetical protein